MKQWSLTRWIATIGCILAAVSLSVFLVLASDRTSSEQSGELSAGHIRMVTPKHFGSYGELMFAYIGEGNCLYNLDDESVPLIKQPAQELLYASDDSVLYVASCEINPAHAGRESIIQELQIGEKENRLNTIAMTTIDPCWSSNDEVIYYVEDREPAVLRTFEPLTSASEAAATFEMDITALRISSDGLLVTLTDGSERLYVPLSKQLTRPGIEAQGSVITVCEQYDLLLSPDGKLSYHWQGADELVQISENAIIGINHQDNEIYYIERTSKGTFLMSYIVSEEQHNTLAALEDSVLPQLTADADYAFVVDEQGIVYRFDTQTEQITPYCFIDLDSVPAPMISLFDYRLMIYDLSAEPDQTYRYSLPADTVLSDTAVEENQARAAEIIAGASELQQYPEQHMLTMGSHGEAVRTFQQALIQAGYLATEPTGFYDMDTMTAVMCLQHDMGYRETGYAERSLQTLVSTSAATPDEPVLTMDSTGSLVRDLQARLRTLRYTSAAPTGIMDEATMDAVSLFCAENGYTLDQAAEFSAEVYQTILSSDAAMYTGYLVLPMDCDAPGAFVLNERLYSLGYMSQYPAPEINTYTMEALSIFADVHGLDAVRQITAELQEAVFAADATPCPDELAPAMLTDTASATEGQVITDKELKILRKWLTKSFAVNHTDRQAVKRLQVRLVHLGYLPSGAQTMIYDADTAAAVAKFQEDNQLDVDGIPTKKTLMLLFGINNATLSGE